ncbi:cbb3-type cytochrome c oxidase subunit 3 [Erythrobacter sp. HKB08]|uniref:cbb3-type cytochrome oxidase subunit 3 n=1 Tax=Erythrobacter sp. HKB08 TaxID=2502843 RepID=UPI00100896A2|nr:cbb3-type cytochrome c oxidase subunit 3 [Erythrobacter sp. HKB08]
MTFYDAFRHFADSYGLALIFTLYLVLCGWAFLPGSHKRNHSAANSIFEDQDHGE